MVLASVAAATLLMDFVVVFLAHFLDPFIGFMGRNQRRTWSDPTSSSGSRPVVGFSNAGGGVGLVSACFSDFFFAFISTIGSSSGRVFFLIRYKCVATRMIEF